MLEELGHSICNNCMRSNRDPFNLFKLIYQTPMSAGGLDANNKPGCGEFDDCRDPEHFFLQLTKRYRLHGDDFRALINNSPDPEVRRRRRAQYLWLKQHWYRGAEFKSGPSRDPLMVKTYGLLCLPRECGIGPVPPPPPPPPPPTRAECLAECSVEQEACIKSGERQAICLREMLRCEAKCPR